MDNEAIKRAWAVEMGSQLAQARKLNNLTQQELADISGISQVTIARIERGTNAPSVSTLGILLSCMGMTMTIHRPQGYGK